MTKFNRHLKDSSYPRTAVLIVGVLAMEIGFIFSYVGGLTKPYPHHVAFGIVGPSGIDTLLAAKIKSSGTQFDPVIISNEKDANLALYSNNVDAYALVKGSSVNVMVSGAPSPAVSFAIQEAVNQLERETGVKAEVHVVNGLPESDPEGLGPFYLVVGWVVGGYLVASALGLARGTEPRLRQALLRSAVLLVFAFFSAVFGVLMVRNGLHLFQGNIFELVLIGILVVYSVAITSSALQGLVGDLGIALSVILFVIIGNPSSGGPFPRAFLSGIWRYIGYYIPTGAGLQGIRNITYFRDANYLGPVWILLIYVIIALPVFLLASEYHGKKLGSGTENQSVEND